MQLELVSLKIFHSMSLFDSTWDETILDRLCLDAAPTCVISTKWKWHKKAEKSERIYKYIFWASHNPIHDFFWCCFFLLHSHLKRYRLTIWVSFFLANVKIFPFLDWSRTVFDWELKHTWKKNRCKRNALTVDFTVIAFRTPQFDVWPVRNVQCAHQLDFLCSLCNTPTVRYW